MVPQARRYNECNTHIGGVCCIFYVTSFTSTKDPKILEKMWFYKIYMIYVS